MSRFVFVFIALWVAVFCYRFEVNSIAAAVHSRLSGSIDSVWAAKPYAAVKP